MAEPTANDPAANTNVRQRLQTVFGWIAGASLGVLASFLVALAVGRDDYPLIPATFGFVVAGCFGGMWLSDKLGRRGFRPLGIAAGVLLALALVLVTLMLASG